MKNVYRSLRGVVHDSLQKNKVTSISGSIKANDSESLSDAVEEFENVVLETFGKLKAAITDAQSRAEAKAENVEQVIDSLRANIALLETKLRETEETMRAKDVRAQRTEESLKSKIADLQSAVNEKNEALENRAAEVNDLKANVALLHQQEKELESSLQQAKDQAASDAQRAENSIESSKATIATLQAQLSERAEITRGKEAALKELEENLTAKIRELESDLRDKETLLAKQIEQVTDLKAELERVSTPMQASSSVSGEAEALGDIGTDRAVVDEQLKTEEQKPPTSHFRSGGAASNVPDADRATVPPEVFDRIIDGLFELTDVMRPIASLILRNHVESLGESMEDFPQARLPELIAALSQEISDDNLRTAFLQRVEKL
jgi:chromosome segregation ATPase